MELRPHHLMCIQGYHGVGYDEGFVMNMDQVVKDLENNPSQKVIIRMKGDVLCAACPERQRDETHDIYKEDSCLSEKLVGYLDRKTLECLKIDEGSYVYQDLVKLIRETLTWDNYCKICGQCEWFKNNVCGLKEKLKNFI